MMNEFQFFHPDPKKKNQSIMHVLQKKVLTGYGKKPIIKPKKKSIFWIDIWPFHSLSRSHSLNNYCPQYYHHRHHHSSSVTKKM